MGVYVSMYADIGPMYTDRRESSPVGAMTRPSRGTHSRPGDAEQMNPFPNPDPNANLWGYMSMYADIGPIYTDMLESIPVGVMTRPSTGTQSRPGDAEQMNPFPNPDPNTNLWGYMSMYADIGAMYTDMLESLPVGVMTRPSTDTPSRPGGVGRLPTSGSRSHPPSSLYGPRYLILRPGNNTITYSVVYDSK